MPNFNEVMLDPSAFMLKDKLLLDPETILTPRVTTQVQPVTTITVANGSQVLVYDVSNPSNPVLLTTIG